MLSSCREKLWEDKEMFSELLRKLARCLFVTFPVPKTEAVCRRTFLTIRSKTNYELVCKRTGAIRF